MRFRKIWKIQENYSISKILLVDNIKNQTILLILLIYEVLVNT